jgi:type III secretion protein N (ATPase)
MGAVTTREHRAMAGKLRELLAKYNEVELLVRIGEYKQGAERKADEAVAKIEAIRGFLRQGNQDLVSFDAVLKQMEAVLA